MKIEWPKPHRPDTILLLTLLGLIAFGLCMVSSAGYFRAVVMLNDSFAFLKQQAVSALISLAVLFIIVYVCKPEFLRQASEWGFLAALVFLVLIFVPGVGIERLGGTRWIRILGFEFMPSEVVKPVLIMVQASWLHRYGQAIKKPLYLTLFLAVTGIVCFLVVRQPDLGTTIVIAGGSLIMFFAGGMKILHSLGIGALGTAVVWYLANNTPYMKNRIDIWQNPFEHLDSGGYQIQQSFYAIASGGLWGLGMGQSRQKYGYLPEPMSDFIYAITAEELGFIGCLFLIGLFTIFLIRCFVIARRSPNLYAGLVVIGLSSLIMLQALINIAVVTSLLPATGIPLPFISLGGTSLIISVASVGVILNISRYTKVNS